MTTNDKAHGIALSELQTLRDEIRVRIHLAGMEAKEQLASLETRFEQLQLDAIGSADSALEKVTEKADDLRASLRALRDRVCGDTATATAR